MAALNATEIRNLLEALNEDILIDDLSTENRNAFFVLIRHILSEQKSVDYAFKTSLLTVFHKLRELEQNPNYQLDNQTYLQDYINEVKPYHSKIREYVLNYTKTDLNYTGNSDFDLPAYYDTSVNRYRSPSGELQTDAERLSTDPLYTDWYNNYKLQVQSISISEGWPAKFSGRRGSFASELWGPCLHSKPRYIVGPMQDNTPREPRDQRTPPRCAPSVRAWAADTPHHRAATRHNSG